ncbi:MAG: hypothetical protein AABY07_03745 [Nanoarchaeota archaeon]
MQSFNKIAFYNKFNSGDLHVSRSFVKEIIYAIPGKEYLYYHKNSHECLRDMAILFSLQQRSLSEAPLFLHEGNPIKDMRSSFIVDNTLYINTWYLAASEKKFEKYGTSLATLWWAITANLEDQVDQHLDLPLRSYIPYIYFDHYEIDHIKRYLEDNNDFRIFVSNGQTLSGQSSDGIDLNRIIFNLAKKHPQIKFLLSNLRAENLLNPLNNIIHTCSIIQKAGCDLNENAYLASKCPIIIGSSSGSYTYSLNHPTIDDATRKYICVSKDHKGLVDFGLSNYSAARFIGIHDTDNQIVEEKIEKEILSCL